MDEIHIQKIINRGRTREKGTRGFGEQGNRGTGEPGNRGTRNKGVWGTREQGGLGNRGTGTRDCELRIGNCKLRIGNCELGIVNWEFRIQNRNRCFYNLPEIKSSKLFNPSSKLWVLSTTSCACDLYGSKYNFSAGRT